MGNLDQRSLKTLRRLTLNGAIRYLKKELVRKGHRRQEQRLMRYPVIGNCNRRLLHEKFPKFWWWKQGWWHYKWKGQCSRFQWTIAQIIWQLSEGDFTLVMVLFQKVLLSNTFFPKKKQKYQWNKEKKGLSFSYLKEPFQRKVRFWSLLFSPVICCGEKNGCPFV